MGVAEICNNCASYDVCIYANPNRTENCILWQPKVVRCKDCQEFAPGFIRPYLGWCSVWDTTVRETGFCHHGKPRSEEKSKPAWPPQEEMEDPCED